MLINQQLDFELPLDLSDATYDVKCSNPPPYFANNFPTFSFRPTSSGHVGFSYSKCIVRNEFSQLPFDLIISVVNNPPFFSSPPSDISVLIDTSATMELNNPEDKEKLTVSIITREQGKQTLPAFISYDKAKREYTISPEGGVNIKKYIIEVLLTDSFGASKSYTFTVEVYEIN